MITIMIRWNHTIAVDSRMPVARAKILMSGALEILSVYASRLYVIHARGSPPTMALARQVTAPDMYGAASMHDSFKVSVGFRMSRKTRS